MCSFDFKSNVTSLMSILRRFRVHLSPIQDVFQISSIVYEKIQSSVFEGTHEAIAAEQVQKPKLSSRLKSKSFSRRSVPLILEAIPQQSTNSLSSMESIQPSLTLIFRIVKCCVFVLDSQASVNILNLADQTQLYQFGYQPQWDFTTKSRKDKTIIFAWSDELSWIGFGNVRDNLYSTSWWQIKSGGEAWLDFEHTDQTYPIITHFDHQVKHIVYRTTGCNDFGRGFLRCEWFDVVKGDVVKHSELFILDGSQNTISLYPSARCPSDINNTETSVALDLNRLSSEDTPNLPVLKSILSAVLDWNSVKLETHLASACDTLCLKKPMYHQYVSGSYARALRSAPLSTLAERYWTVSSTSSAIRLHCIITLLYAMSKFLQSDSVQRLACVALSNHYTRNGIDTFVTDTTGTLFMPSLTYLARLCYHSNIFVEESARHIMSCLITRLPPDRIEVDILQNWWKLLPSVRQSSIVQNLTLISFVEPIASGTISKTWGIENRLAMTIIGEVIVAECLQLNELDTDKNLSSPILATLFSGQQSIVMLKDFVQSALGALLVTTVQPGVISAALTTRSGGSQIKPKQRLMIFKAQVVDMLVRSWGVIEPILATTDVAAVCLIFSRSTNATDLEIFNTWEEVMARDGVTKCHSFFMILMFSYCLSSGSHSSNQTKYSPTTVEQKLNLQPYPAQESRVFAALVPVSGKAIAFSFLHLIDVMFESLQSPKTTQHPSIQNIKRRHHLVPAERFSQPPRKALPQIVMASIMTVVDASPDFVVAVICSELATAGVKDKDWERVNAVLQVVLPTIIRERPMTFFPSHLPKLVECIVRGTLEPLIPFQIREKLLPHVTSCVHTLIRTFPTVAFHAYSQKLAVGVSHDAHFLYNEYHDPDVKRSSVKADSNATGTVILWDLKTASRICICDAHRPHSISALAFNRPGASGKSRRNETKDEILLASYSIDEKCVKIWQPSSNFLSALASSFASSFSFASEIKSKVSAAASSVTAGGRTNDEGLLSTISGGGSVMKLYRQFAVDALPVLELCSSTNSRNEVTVEENIPNPRGRKRRGMSMPSSKRVLQHVALEWSDERTVTLKRVEPAASLTFKV